MIFWKNKEDWGGHDCCLALTEEVKTLVDALSKVEGLCDTVEMARYTFSKEVCYQAGVTTENMRNSYYSSGKGRCFIEKRPTCHTSPRLEFL